MWTKERMLETMTGAPKLCVLLLSHDTDGVWLCRSLSENGVAIPCSKARNEKAAIRRMAGIYRKTAEKSRRITIAHTDDLAAAYLAGLIGRDTSFERLDPALGTLALLYSGSLRSTPLV